jgi:hypothetical protein
MYTFYVFLNLQHKRRTLYAPGHVYMCHVFHNIVGAHCFNSDLRSIIATATLDTIVAFVIPLVALPTSSPIIWRIEHLCNLSVLQIVQLPNLVIRRVC